MDKPKREDFTNNNGVVFEARYLKALEKYIEQLESDLKKLISHDKQQIIDLLKRAYDAGSGNYHDTKTWKVLERERDDYIDDLEDEITQLSNQGEQPSEPSEELLRESFQLGQQWVQDINNGKDPLSFNGWLTQLKQKR